MADGLVLTIDGEAVIVPQNLTVAAAIALCHGAAAATRRSVSGTARGPFCGMGVCQECRVTIDDVPHRLACQTLCAAGMRIVTETGHG